MTIILHPLGVQISAWGGPHYTRTRRYQWRCDSTEQNISTWIHNRLQAHSTSLHELWNCSGFVPNPYWPLVPLRGRISRSNANTYSRSRQLYHTRTCLLQCKLNVKLIVLRDNYSPEQAASPALWPYSVLSPSIAEWASSMLMCSACSGNLACKLIGLTCNEGLSIWCLIALS